METLMTKLQTFCKAQPVLLIAFFAAILTMLFVPPDRGYLSYCNRTVLIQLFCLMMAVAGFRSIGVFETVTDLLLKRAGTLRKLGMILTLLCFFVSMLVTNDVALLTLIPLTLLVYDQISDEKSRILTIVLETAAANLGSMVTPFGNPQNLYLFDFYHLTLQEFFCTMLPAGMVSLVCLVMLGFLLPSTPCNARPSEKKVIPKLHFTGYGVLFLLCLLTVFRVIPDWCCLIAAVMVPLALNKSLFRKVDYALLATFVCFFVFVGNIARMETVSNFLSDILAGRELLISALLSQGISNVPAAVMLSGFTEQGTELLLGINLGGLGSIIASLASLISFQFYRSSANAAPKKYLFVFSVVNFGLLALLLLLAQLGILSI